LCDPVVGRVVQDAVHVFLVWARVGGISVKDFSYDVNSRWSCQLCLCL
jgi:hypothetical protein